MYAVTVTFEVRPEKFVEFVARVKIQAAESHDREPGCRQFDVCTSAERPNEVFLYETYADRTAFEIHLAAAHFLAFDREVTPLVLSKTVASWDIHPAAGLVSGGEAT